VAELALKDHPGDIILYFGPWRSDLRTVLRLDKKWLCDNFSYRNKKLQGKEPRFLAFPGSKAAEFIQVVKYMGVERPPRLSAVSDGNQRLHYSAIRVPKASMEEGIHYLDPIAVYALAEKLEHDGVMMKIIDLLHEFFERHDAVPHESLIERVYKITRTGSSLRRFLLPLWIEELGERKIGGVAYLHLVDCLEDDSLPFNIRYLMGVYRGLKVNVWGRGPSKYHKLCHCATCQDMKCLACKRRVCNGDQ